MDSQPMSNGESANGESSPSVVSSLPGLMAQSNPVLTHEIVAAHSPASAQVEALRTVRSQLSLRWFNGDPAQRVLAVVSAERGEGRSFIAANLATLLSQPGLRTLLIDADLRNPAQQALFGLGHTAGLSDVLAGSAPSDVVHAIASLPGLFVLTAGTVSSSAADLLARPNFAHLLRDAATRFDAVVVDTPALGAAADAQIVAAAAGAALIVTRQNQSRVARVRGVVDALHHAKATIVGAVLNDA